MSRFALLDLLARLWADLDAMQREKAVAFTVLELKELENIFGLLIVGAFAGIPAPPTFLVLELLPLMEDELRILNLRAEGAGDMLAEMVGSLGIG